MATNNQKAALRLGSIEVVGKIDVDVNDVNVVPSRLGSIEALEKLLKTSGENPNPPVDPGEGPVFAGNKNYWIKCYNDGVDTQLYDENYPHNICYCTESIKVDKTNLYNVSQVNQLPKTFYILKWDEKESAPRMYTIKPKTVSPIGGTPSTTGVWSEIKSDIYGSNFNGGMVYNSNNINGLNEFLNNSELIDDCYDFNFIKQDPNRYIISFETFNQFS